MKNKKLFILLLLVPIIIFFVGRSFSLPYTEEIRSVEIQSNDYNQPGSWHIDKSAEWTSLGKARVTFDVNSVIKTEEGRYKDVIIVIDISGSMSGYKLERAIADSLELTKYLLSDNHNRIALISFDSTSTIVSGFTNNKNEMIERINSLKTNGCTNYNAGLLNVVEVMEDYEKVDDHDLVTLFLTDGYPNEDTPNQKATYHLLKDKYPYMTINGIQYEMGKDIIQEIIDISDNQWVADQDTLHNVLFDATISPLTYDNFIITDYINDEYFYINSVDDIKVDRGEITLTEENGVQKTTWNLGNFYKTGDNIQMIINLNLKEEYHNTKGYYPTNKSETINSKLPNEEEKVVDSTLTPVLKNAYNVIYDANAPDGCSLPIYDPEEHYIYQNVTKKTEILSCTGYIFKGWQIDSNDKEDIKIINDDMFVMPPHDVHIRAAWTKQDLVKSMDGVVHEKMTLYKVLQNEANRGTYAKKYTGNHQDSMDNSGTSDIYYYYASNDVNANSILNKNNVIFANHCWQMIRTTDTGGVKMIYNGEPENGKCLKSRGSHVGYVARTYKNLASNYWYGTDYTYDSSTNEFELSGTTEQVTWNSTNGPNLVGKYTCMNTSESDSCSTLYLVESYYNTTNGYVIPLKNNSHYSQFGELQFNKENNSPAYVGYMYNTVYPRLSYIVYDSDILFSQTSLSTSYWYADSVTWGSPEENVYNLDNPYQVTSTADYANLVGKYTFRKNTETYTNTSVYHIAGVNGSTMYYFELNNTGNHTLADFDYSFTFGNSYTKNSDGTYTIINTDGTPPSTIKKSEWYSNYSNVKNYICKNATNDTCRNVWYITHKGNYYLEYLKSSNSYKFAKDFEYKLDPSSGTYKYYLKDDNDESVIVWNTVTNKSKINNAHYTCWNTSGVCTDIYYVWHISGANPLDIKLSGGKNIEDAKNEMLYNDDVNKTNSIIKNGVEAWYKHNLLKDYDDYIEDAIYCNDRRQSNATTNGWNPDGGSVSSIMNFNASKDLSCPNETDRFSTLNSKAQLTYKVGLITYREMSLLGNQEVRNTKASYWLGTPNNFYYNGDTNVCFTISGNIDFYTGIVTEDYGVRPVISLIPYIEYSSGDGSMEHPYLVDTSVN